MQGNVSIQKTAIPVQYNLTQQADIARSQTVSGLLVFLIPVVVICAIAGCRKYKTRVFQQRIHRLNRIWQLDSSKNLS